MQFLAAIDQRYKYVCKCRLLITLGNSLDLDQVR